MRITRRFGELEDGVGVEADDAAVEGGAREEREPWVDWESLGPDDEFAKMERQLDALWMKVRNFSERPSYSTPSHPSSARRKRSSIVFLHSRMSYSNSAESTRTVAVLAVPAGPVRTRMR